MSMTTPIVDFVQNYAKSGTSRLHMPGHKGQALLGFEGLDITEIRGADELYEADGIIAQSEANATRLFGTAHTYYSTEGSSQCIRAMLALALQGAPKTGKRPVLLAARNAGTQCWSRTENDLTGDGIYVSGELPAENGNWRPAGAELQLSWRLGVAHVTHTTLIFAGRMLLIKLNRF